MKLFRVTIEYAVIVVARDPHHAEQVADAEVRHITAWEEPTGSRTVPAPITNLDQLSDGWQDVDMPYGIPEHDTRQTIAAWLDSPDPLTESVAPMSEQPKCPKVQHASGSSGYLHGADDDAPYDVDGVLYCGRCHSAWPHPLTESELEQRGQTNLLAP